MKENKIAFYSILVHIFFIVFVTIVIVQNGNMLKPFQLESIAASSGMLFSSQKNEEVSYIEDLVPQSVAVMPASIIKSAMEIYDEMSISDLENALQNGTLTMQYSAFYTSSSERLSVSRGALYFNGHKETYYSEKVLPGASLAIPGRHVADDGTIRDGDGFICVAADPSYMAKYSTLITSLGPAKVYDTGCAYGTVDIYTSW